MESEILDQLLVETWKSPVFGDSFDEYPSAGTGLALSQVEAVLGVATVELRRYIGQGMPECDEEEVSAIVGQIAPKTVSFCPALAAGELDDTSRLSASATAIGLMYWADQTMDRGDESMPIAIELFGGHGVPVPKKRAKVVHSRLAALSNIEDKINELARPEDIPFVLSCFREQVLLNEVHLHRLSIDYLNANNQGMFLAVHAEEIARSMVVDAGFPSVSSCLYAIYRQHNPDLPSLGEMYAESTLVEMLQICNAVVRVADELGDREIDAGSDPAWGSFAINLFNQAHPSLSRAFLEEAGIRDEVQAESLTEALAEFREGDGDREKYGDYVVDVIFEHARSHINDLPLEIQNTYHLYIKLCKRVLEIGYVNRVGDMALAGADCPANQSCPIRTSRLGRLGRAGLGEHRTGPVPGPSSQAYAQRHVPTWPDPGRRLTGRLPGATGADSQLVATEQEADDAAGQSDETADDKLEKLAREFGEGWPEQYKNEAEDHGKGHKSPHAADYPALQFVSDRLE